MYAFSYNTYIPTPAKQVHPYRVLHIAIGGLLTLIF